MINYIAALHHQRYILPSSYFLALAIGLIGTKYFWPLTVFILPVLPYSTEVIYYIKNGYVKDLTLRDMLKKTCPFVFHIKKMFVIGFVTGVLSNILFYFGRQNMAYILIICSIFFAFFLQLGEKWRSK